MLLPPCCQIRPYRLQRINPSDKQTKKVLAIALTTYKSNQPHIIFTNSASLILYIVFLQKSFTCLCILLLLQILLFTNKQMDNKVPLIVRLPVNACLLLHRNPRWMMMIHFTTRQAKLMGRRKTVDKGRKQRESAGSAEFVRPIL